MPGLAAALLLLAAAPTPAPEELSQFAVQKLVERTRGAVLHVVSEPRGTAVLIGVQGELLADERLVAKDRLTVEIDGERREALLVERDREIGVALLKLPAGDYPAAVVGSVSLLPPGGALVGLSFDGKGALRAEVGHFAGLAAAKESPASIGRLRNDVAGPSGSALFNSKGHLVAIHAGRPRGTLSIDALRARFASAKGQLQ